MAAKDEFSKPVYVLDWLSGLGTPYTSMDGDIATWWEWYTATSKWYRRTGFDYQRKRKRRYRLYTLHPARRVCREWASLMFDGGTAFTADAERADAWLKRWAHDARLLVVGKRCAERSFALGTGAIALWFDVPESKSAPVRIRPRRYDARMIVPLDWDDDEVTACAFVTTAYVGGRRVTQACAHVPNSDSGTYHVLTRMWDSRGAVVEDGSVIADLDTLQPLPTFAVMRPALDNCVADGSPFGVSVFNDAINACMAVDEAFDACVRELLVCKPRLFVSDDLLQVVDERGRKVVVPSAPEETVIRSVTGMTGDEMMKTFQPQLRSDQLTRMLNEAKAQLGDLTGFGSDYFCSDRQGGLKTATEVAADSSALMRNLANHEAEAGSTLSRTLSAAVSCARSLCGADVEDGAVGVEVTWDDSIVEDTPAEKAQMQAEIAAGIAAPWEYRARFYGEPEEVARERAAEASSGSAPTPALDAAFGAAL